jgi:hypothetical protein
MNECPIAANAAIKHKGRQYNVWVTREISRIMNKSTKCKSVFPPLPWQPQHCKFLVYIMHWDSHGNSHFSYHVQGTKDNSAAASMLLN